MLKEMLANKMASMPSQPPDDSAPEEADDEQEASASKLTISPEEMPEIKNWKVGGEYHVVLKVKQTSPTGDFQVLEAAPIDDAEGEKDLEEEENNESPEEEDKEESYE